MPKIIALALALYLLGASAPSIWAQQVQQTPPRADSQAAMTARAESIIAEAAQSTGLLTSFGNPAWVMDAGKNRADVLVEFQHGPLPDLAAAEFGMIACARLAQSHVAAKTPVRRLGVTVTSPLPDGRIRVYGTAIYNGNLAALIWENAGLNLATGAAPKMPDEAKAKAATEKAAQPQKPQAAANAGAGNGQESPCPYVQGLANPDSRPMPPAPGRPSGPRTGCPYLNGVYSKKKAPDNAANSTINVNPAEQSCEVMAQAILDDTAAELGVRDFFGNPAYTLEATDRKASMMVQFRQGPLPEDAAMAYGLAACENLARAYVVKGLGIKKLALTVTCLLPNGGMNIYGTAVFNGNLEDIKWQNAGLTVNPGPGQSPVPPLPYVAQPNSPNQQPAQRRPLNIQRAPQNLKPAIPQAAQNRPIPNEAAPNAAQQPNAEPRQPMTQEQPLAQNAVPRPKQPAAQAQEQPAAQPGQQQQTTGQKPAAEQKPAQKPLEEQTPNNANEANQASYSFATSQIINRAVRAIGLQSTYGLPEYSVIAGDRKADIDIIFKRGPMPDSSAASFGLMACEQLARACMAKGLETRYLGVTVSYMMQDGRRYDYGTAIFNGNLDNLSWVVIDRII